MSRDSSSVDDATFTPEAVQGLLGVGWVEVRMSPTPQQRRAHLLRRLDLMARTARLVLPHLPQVGGQVSIS